MCKKYKLFASLRFDLALIYSVLFFLIYCKRLFNMHRVPRCKLFNKDVTECLDRFFTVVSARSSHIPASVAGVHSSAAPLGPKPNPWRGRFASAVLISYHTNANFGAICKAVFKVKPFLGATASILNEKKIVKCRNTSLVNISRVSPFTEQIWNDVILMWNFLYLHA